MPSVFVFGWYGGPGSVSFPALKIVAALVSHTFFSDQSIPLRVCWIRCVSADGQSVGLCVIVVMTTIRVVRLRSRVREVSDVEVAVWE